MRERFLRPRDEELVGARNAVPGRESRARVRDDRPPPDRARSGGERLGRVDGAVDEQPRRRPEHVGEHAPTLDLGDAAVPTANQPVGLLVVALAQDARRPVLQIREDHRVRVVVRDALQLLEQLRVGDVDPHVDLAPAWKAHAECEVVRDAERQQARWLAAEDLPRRVDHLALDAAARDRAGELAALGDSEFRADWPRGGPPGRDDARERHALTARAPTIQVVRQLPHGAIVVSAGRPQPAWQSQICSPSLRRSRLRPQRAHVGGRIFAATRSPRISVAQSTT